MVEASLNHELKALRTHTRTRPKGLQITKCLWTFSQMQSLEKILGVFLLNGEYIICFTWDMLSGSISESVSMGKREVCLCVCGVHVQVCVGMSRSEM